MTDLLPVLCGAAVVLSLLAFGFSLLRLRRVANEAASPSNGGSPTGFILLVVIVLTSGGVASIWLLNKPVYRATAVVRISPTIEPIVFNTDNNVTAEYYPLFVNTELHVIHSPTVLERVLDQSEIRDTDWYKDINKQELASESVQFLALQDGLEVSPRTGTELIDVSFTAAKADDAKIITNQVVVQYKRQKAEAERTYKTQLFETLTNEQATLQMEIDGLLKTKFNIARRFNTDRLDDLRAEMSKRFDAMESEVYQRQREIDMLNWDMKVGTTGDNPSSWPAEINKRNWALKSQLNRKTQEIQLLKNDLEKQRAKLVEAGEISQEISNYDERIHQKRELYDSVRTRREHLEMEEKTPGRVRVASYAVEPNKPYNDRRALLTGIVVAAATIVSLSVVALRPRT